jgi:GT2 family glycosyltransferase
MPDIAIITTCMGRLEHLQQSLPTWLIQDAAEIVVVDYSCPQRSGEWVEQTHPGVKIVRCEGKAHFRIAEARNLGAAASTAAWLCFVDADVLLMPDFLSKLSALLHRESYFRSELGASADLMGTVLIPREAFESVGGYDEAFEGWGAEDYDLYLRLQSAGLNQAVYPSHLVRPISHDDSMRTRHARIPERVLGWNVNRFYIETKMGIRKMVGKELPLASRRALYAHIRSAVLAGADEPEVRVEFALGSEPKITRADVEFRLMLALKHPRSD